MTTEYIDAFVVAINKDRKARRQPLITVEQLNAWLDDHDDVNSNPKSPDFLAGASVARMVAMLRHVDPEKAEAFGVLLRSILRIEFEAIGPNPREAAKGCV